MIEKITIIYIINIALSFLNAKINPPGSDHFYHLSLINLIRKNRHRFIDRHSQLLDHKNLSYPQFLHWLLSFLSDKQIVFQTKHMNNIISFLNVSLFLFLGHTLVSLGYFENLPEEDLLFYGGLLYVVTPFNYVSWNAKNTGLSARGFGLMLVFLYLINIALKLHIGDVYFTAVGIAICFLIVTGSQLAFQFVILSLPFLVFFTNDPLILVPPFGAILLFYLLMPKVATSWMRGQFYHKYLYAFYMAKVFILLKRYSIWRDFVYDFWKKILENKKRGLWYMYNNPAINVLKGFPIVIFLLIWLNIENVELNDLEMLFVYFIYTSLILFFLISFRITRFLGEPERYIEFIVPFSSLLFVSNFNDTKWLLILVIVCILLTLMEFGVSYLQKTEQSGGRFKKIEELKSILAEKYMNSNTRLFSNNIELLKYFLSEDIRVLWPHITALKTGPFHFKEVYQERYPIVSKTQIVPLIETFNVNYFLHDKNSGEDALIDSGLDIENVLETPDFRVYKVQQA